MYSEIAFKPDFAKSESLEVKAGVQIRDSEISEISLIIPKLWVTTPNLMAPILTAFGSAHGFGLSSHHLAHLTRPTT